MSVLSKEFWSITPLNQQKLTLIQQHIDNKTKPLGALGRLESMAAQLALVLWDGEKEEPTFNIENPTIMVFAADHGIARQGVSIAPPDVTRQMVLNFLAGGAAINSFCDANSVSLIVVDAGMMTPVNDERDDFIISRLGPGTHDLSLAPAMTPEQCEQGVLKGAKAAKDVIALGTNLVGFGEMGIGNTSAAAAMLAAFSGQTAAQVTGFGTGISPEQYAKKVALIDQALSRIKGNGRGKPDIKEILIEVGGFEIVQIIGAMLSTAQAGKMIVVDGFIVSVAALFACQIAPEARQFMLFAHTGAEKSHRQVLSMLDAEPLLDFSLRLGEGTGAALAIPVIRAAEGFFNHMATFESANVKV